MSTWFYYDNKGQKLGPVSGGQLKGLAKAGMITPETVIETEEGKKAAAGKVKGLTFIAAEQPQPASPRPQAVQPVPPITAPPPPPPPPPPVASDDLWDWSLPESEISSLITASQAPSTPQSPFQPSAPPPPRKAAAPRQHRRGNINTYLVWSIITTLCCFPLLGIPAIIFSVLCGSDLKAGNYDTAAKRSSIAFWCNVIGLALACLQVSIALLLPAIQAAREAAARANVQNAQSNPNVPLPGNRPNPPAPGNNPPQNPFDPPQNPFDPPRTEATPQAGQPPTSPQPPPVPGTPTRLSAYGPIRQLVSAVDRYQRDLGQYPTTSQGLAALYVQPANLPASANWRGPYLAIVFRERMTTDPWGQPIRYASPGKNGRNYDIWSVGPDGIDGNADDVGNWMSLRDL